MVNTNAECPPLIFRGTPRHLVLHGELPKEAELEFEADEKLAPLISDNRHTCKVRKCRNGNLKKLKIRLNESTPPGQYHACFKRSNGSSIPVQIEVSPRTRVTISPAQFTFTGRPGDKVIIYLLFSNKGNVSCTIPATDSVGIFDDDGIETAFASTYRMDSNKLESLFSHFTDKLREAHGGLLKIRLLEGHGSLDPGTHRSVQLEAQIPSKVKPGHNYHGVWNINSSGYAVSVTVTK